MTSPSPPPASETSLTNNSQVNGPGPNNINVINDPPRPLTITNQVIILLFTVAFNTLANTQANTLANTLANMLANTLANIIF